MKTFLSLVIVLSISQYCSSQSYSTSGDIYLGLKKLNTLGSVLYVAAHPDDENTRLITYFSKDRLYRTGYLSITRGDGGQNLIGDEQGIGLGLIRTQELLAARRIDGGEQFFTRAYDFGYSKTPAETFEKWDKEKILHDVVWVIRQFKPDVIITRFPTTGEGGHGHHTASAILANEAFTAAADPKRFPEQLKYTEPWQAKSILWNSFNFGGNNTTREDQFKFDVGGYNPVLGKSYGEIAAESRSQHKSQGFGVPKSRGEAFEYFSLTGGSAFSKDLFDDIDTDWSRVKGEEVISKKVEQIIASFDFLQPQKSVPGLVSLYKALEAIPDGYWRNQKLKEVSKLIEDASGLWVETVASSPFAVQGDSLRFTTTLNNRLGVNARLLSVKFNGYDTAVNQELSKNKNLVFSKTLYINPEQEYSQPYWLREKMEEGYFTVNDLEDIGQPDVDPGYTANYQVLIEGVRMQFTKPVKYKFTDPVKGEVYQPVTIIPAFSVNIDPARALFKKGDTASKNAYVELRANRNIAYQNATAMLRTSEKAITAKDGEKRLTKGDMHTIEMKISPRDVVSSGETAMPFVRLNKDTGSHFLALAKIEYDHIPNISYLYTDGVKLLNIDLKTRGKRVGYLVGAGDKVPEALEEMGYEVILLTEKEISRNNLQQYDAIISGVRAYNTNEWLNKYHDKLMKYVENGGNLIVQYNTSNQIGPVRAKIGPYEFNISRTRITDETSPVSFANPQHQVLNYPNKINAKDFEGWVQERSIYHADKFNAPFESILTMHDPGEKEQNGSLIIAKHGKGFFTYTGLVFFRQLPAGVPGAYRILANLIALNQKKEI